MECLLFSEDKEGDEGVNEVGVERGVSGKGLRLLKEEGK